MKFERKGEWLVSTPILMGSSDDVWKAQSCAHVDYAEGTRKIQDGMLLVQERCQACVATRVKYRPVTEGDERIVPR